MTDGWARSAHQGGHIPASYERLMRRREGAARIRSCSTFGFTQLIGSIVMASLNSRSTTFAFSWFRPDGRAGHGRSRAAVLLAAGGVLALLGWPDGAGAVEVNTGFVGIAPGQVAQLNVGGISSPDIFPNPAAGACRVRLTLRAA